MSLEHAIRVLSAARDVAVEKLKVVSAQDRQRTLQEKVELHRAIGCLRLCAEYRIEATDRVITLPEKTTATPTSEYRVLEDHESDDRQRWTEVAIEGAPVRPVPGALIVERAGRRR